MANRSTHSSPTFNAFSLDPQVQNGGLMKTRKLTVARLAARAFVCSAAIGLGLGGVSACGTAAKHDAGGTGGVGGGNGTGGSGVGGTGYAIGPDGGQVQVDPNGQTVTDDLGTFTCYQITCEGHLLACGDCVDNNDDGLIDSHDPECLGPCDNTEEPALTAAVGGENGGPCKADCYFDFGNGSGGDDCIWDHQCDVLSVAPDYHPEGVACAFDQSLVGSKDCPSEQSATCLATCRPLTPNGCDCFGCCTFPSLQGEFVWIGSVEPNDSNDGSCTFDQITDPTKCEPCTPVENCFNDCGVCELCLGKNTLPPECLPPDAGGPPPPGSRCDAGIQPCGLPGDPACPPGDYCVTGCCQETIR